ncbi:MAG: GTP-binding protein [Candidatus Helarchaeota archaeon]
MIVDFKWKVVVVGNPTAGKTTLMLQYTEKKFNELYIPTVGVQVSIKQVPIQVKKEKRLVELNIWDIAGHVKFQHIRKIFYEGAQAFLCLYDCTNEQSFNGVAQWINDIKDQIGNQYGILIGNKIDLKKERVISEEQGKEKAESFLLDFMETSAKTGKNVEKVFFLITSKLLEIYG